MVLVLIRSGPYLAGYGDAKEERCIIPRHSRYSGGHVQKGAWGWSLQRVGQVPACSCSGCKSMSSGNPCKHPTLRRRIAGTEPSWSGYIVEKALHPGSSVNSGWRQWPSAAWRRLDATRPHPISAEDTLDLLPATTVGGTSRNSH